MAGMPVSAEASWFETGARQRITGLLDAGSFREALPPTDRVRSPHFAALDLPAAFDDDVPVATRGASPAVMDLPSIARVTELPKEELGEMARTTPVFASGLDPLFETGAVTAIWDAGKPLDERLAPTLAHAEPEDGRGALGRERGGRTVSAEVARRVAAAVRGAA